MQYVVLDIEALGVSINSRIIQMSVCILNEQTLDIDKHITYNVEDYDDTLISPATISWMKENAPHLFDIMKESPKVKMISVLGHLAYHLTSDHILIGWNIHYDYSLLQHRYLRTGFRLNHHLIDLHTLAFCNMKPSKPIHLDDALEYYNIDTKGYTRHNAHDDALLEAKLFKVLYNI